MIWGHDKVQLVFHNRGWSGIYVGVGCHFAPVINLIISRKPYTILHLGMVLGVADLEVADPVGVRSPIKELTN